MSTRKPMLGVHIVEIEKYFNSLVINHMQPLYIFLFNACDKFYICDSGR